MVDKPKVRLQGAAGYPGGDGGQDLRPAPTSTPRTNKPFSAVILRFETPHDDLLGERPRVSASITSPEGTSMTMHSDDAPGERLISTEEVAELLGVSSRTVLNLPIKQYRLGPRTFRFRLRDVYDYLGADNPNL